MTLGTLICVAVVLLPVESPSKKDLKKMDTIHAISSKSDIQQLLKEGFDTMNIRKFQMAISLGANLDEPFEDDEYAMTVYELVLSKYGYFKFVRACINAGCDVNYVSLQL